MLSLKDHNFFLYQLLFGVLALLAVSTALPKPKAKPDFTVQPGDDGTYSGDHGHHHEDHHHSHEDHDHDLNAPPPPPPPPSVDNEPNTPHKECKLIKSTTAINQMCFYEPECQNICQNVPQQVCQPSVEQVCNQINVTACNVVQEEVCQTNYVTQFENKCETKLEEKCRTR